MGRFEKLNIFTTYPSPPPQPSLPFRAKWQQRFVNVKFSLRFVMVSVSDPIVDDDSDDEEGSAPDSPGLTSLSYAMADVDIM